MMQPKTVAPCLLPRLQADLPDLEITLVYLNLSMPITLTLTCAIASRRCCVQRLLLGRAAALRMTKLQACGSMWLDMRSLPPPPLPPLAPPLWATFTALMC